MQAPDIEIKTTMGARYHVRVMDKNGRVVRDYGEQKNLLLPTGYDASSNFQATMGAAISGTGSTPNKSTLNGTFEQTGTTVTRASGTGTFVSGNVGDFIKFATGERAVITAFTNSVTVTVDRSQTVAAAALTVYDTSRQQLDTTLQRTNTVDTAPGANGYSRNTDAGTQTYWKTFNFTTETSARTYTEIGFARNTTPSTPLFGRLVLDSPVNVAIDQFLQVKVTLVMVVGNYRTSAPITVSMTGWPVQYAVQSIVANGTYFDVTLDRAHHYAAGRPVTISGALPATKNISGISSTSSDFTVTTATNHGFAPGDSVVIAGATPSGYNGTWVVATAPTSTTFTVTSAINPGAGSGGTVRFSTPGTWFNGTWTIASIPSSAVLRITSAITPPAAGVAGTVQNSLAANCIIAGDGFFNNNNNSLIIAALDATQSGSYNRSMVVFDEANMKTGMVYGTTTSNSGGFTSKANALTSGFYDATNRKLTATFSFASAEIISTSIRQLCINAGTGQVWITFDERQRKDNGYILNFTYSLSWEPELN